MRKKAGLSIKVRLFKSVPVDMLWQACFTFPDVMTLEKPLFHFLGIFEIVLIKYLIQGNRPLCEICKVSEIDASG